jgi:hypothetical protein
MPPELQSGVGNIRNNMQILMQPPQSRSRKKGIVTLAKRRNISRADAQFIQARAIAVSKGRKK